VLGPEHPDTLVSVNNLACLLSSRGDHVGAQPLYERALEASERVLGPEHPDTLISVSGLALLLHQEGDVAGAQPLYERALTGLLKISAAAGRPHPSLQAFIGNYAECLKKMGHDGAEIRAALNALMRPFGMGVGGSEAGAGAPQNEPSPKLRAIIEQLMRDPLRLQELAEQLRREDPELFLELVQWIQSQQPR